MAKGIQKLTARQVETAKPRERPYLIPDGGSLYLRVAPSGSRSWVYRFRDRNRKLHELGLGSYTAVGLAEARQRAHKYRTAHKQGNDPLGSRTPTFERLALDYIELLGTGAKPLSGSSLIEWSSTLRRHVFPSLGAARVDRITAKMVETALRPAWEENASAKRILDRVKKVLDRAVALGYRTDNPAAWALQQHLLGKAAAKTGKHHAAHPWREMPELMAKLRSTEGVEARALEFLILAGSPRAAQVIGSRKKGREIEPLPWSEIDLEARLWTISGDRMKLGVTHVVPLCDGAIAILVGLPQDGSEVFPGVVNDKAMLNVLDRMGYREATVHGFRSAFQDWAAENGVDQRLVDFALAHRLPDQTMAAYYRTTRVAERAKIMQRWCDFLSTPAADVVSLRRA
jgi:integrase